MDLVTAKVIVLGFVGAMFFAALYKRWEGAYILFGLVFLLGSCQMLGVH